MQGDIYHPEEKTGKCESFKRKGWAALLIMETLRRSFYINKTNVALDITISESTFKRKY